MNVQPEKIIILCDKFRPDGIRLLGRLLIENLKKDIRYEDKA